ncbi:ATPase inhibitor subunit zeta [Bosea sp. 2YAB26]|uniref:ATPase inhibitor subunit zeta n=1 Tax=Bosea sp. 2YAB26 TaxID=3237478 RepID=UPI003F8F54B6
MTSSNDVQRTIIRNKLLGRWAAEKLALTGRDADAYSDDLARSTVDPERSDVFSKIRKDFDAAGVAQSDEQILRVMTEFMLKAGSLMPTTRGGSRDAAAVMLARNLQSG